jgi:hypothetical protein
VQYVCQNGSNDADGTNRIRRLDCRSYPSPLLKLKNRFTCVTGRRASFAGGVPLAVLGGLPETFSSYNVPIYLGQYGVWHMPVVVMVAHLGDAELASEVRAAIEHVLADHAGDWRVSLIGSQANDRWELKVEGPNLFERSYILEGTAGEHCCPVKTRTESVG